MHVAGIYNLKNDNLSLFNFGFVGHTARARILRHKQKRPWVRGPGTSSFLFSPISFSPISRSAAKKYSKQRYCALGGRLYVASYFTTL
jgi:hypothetical protein